MKIGPNVCLHEILDKFENGSCLVKTRSLGQTLEKPCVCCRDQIFGLILMKRVFALMKPCTVLKMGQIGSKTRSLGQIIEDLMLVTKGCDLNSCS